MMKKKNCEHKIDRVLPGSIAQEMDIEPGDVLLSVNGADIEDVFDYRYQINEEYVTAVIRKPDGEEWELEIEKEYGDDLGIEFENGLMDDYRSCCNKCIFCFIDQMPRGMRKTLYFKDDDARLSFLQGNYVTLTNMTEHDIKRIIEYKLEPINISVQTMNPELRCRMLNNRFAGDVLKNIDLLYEAGITMNGQIVLCRGVNDGEELEYTIRGLTKYLPFMESVSVVPVGLSRFREGLYPLEPFTEEDAGEVLGMIRRWQQVCLEKWGSHFVHASDEWYLLAGEELPQASEYDGFPQLENGVGMLRLLLDEFYEALYAETDGERGGFARTEKNARRAGRTRTISVATGMLAAPFLERMARDFMEKHPGTDIRVHAVKNDFFGESITVSGLLTGRDLLAQLKDKELGERLLLPCNMLRSGEEVFLDDMTVTELIRALQVDIDIVNSNGRNLYEAFCRE